VDHVERLADYLAGELAADEQAAFEAQLARDPALRSQLDAVRRADASLDRLASPNPPEGFEARLDARLDRELPAILDLMTSTETETAASTPVDELAERRARRTPPRWLLAASGAAAALVVVAGGGLAIRGMLGPGADETADGASLTQTFGLDADDAPAEDAESLVEAADGPLIVATGRELDNDTADMLVEDDLALGLADRGLDPVGAAATRSSFLDVFLGGAPAQETDPLEAPADDADDAVGADAPDSDERDDMTFAIDPTDPRLRIEGAVTDDDLADVARCLDVVLRDSPDAIPTYAEIGTRDGDEVVALGLVTSDPATGTFARRELWVLDRATCDVRHIVQR
jgi:hypothetical protein